jgi:hypothetical protein
MNIPVAIYSMFLLLLDTLLLGIQVDLEAFRNCWQISSIKFKLHFHLQPILSSTPGYTLVLCVQVST